MKHSGVAVLLLLALSAVSLVAATTTLADPVQISSASTNWAATMTVEAARFSNTHMSWSSRQYCYLGVCSIPGPTIRVKPGDTFNLTIINNLGQEGAWYTHNTFHSPNSTNVHTHGLHIDPNTDSVFIRIAPGGYNYTYNFKIAANHFPGTHWYHSHSHGNSALQVQGGLYGMLLVEPTTAHNLPSSITSLTQHQVVLTQMKWNQVTANGAISQGCCFGCACTVYQGCNSSASAPFAPFRAYSYPEISNEIGNKLTPLPVWTSVEPTLTNVLYINGQYKPNLDMVVGTPHYLRILNAGSVYRTGVRVVPSSACSMTVIGVDGVYTEATQTRTTLYMFASTRYDVVLKCSQTAQLIADYGENYDQWSKTILTLTVSSGSTDVAVPTNAEMAAIVRPYYLQSLLTTSVPDTKNQNEVHFSQGGRNLPQCGFWLGMGSNCSRVWEGVEEPSTTNPTCSFEQMPGSQGGTGYASSPPTGHYKYVTTTGTVNEWRIYGLGNDAHPFHLHVHHFQIVAFQKLPSSQEDYTPYFTIGEWRDTLPALDAKITIRFRAIDYPGQSVLHCHVLRHEDLGMMSSIYICDSSSTNGLAANGCPARNVSDHVQEYIGYNEIGTYDNRGSSSSGGGGGTTTTSTGTSTSTTSTGGGRPAPPPGQSTGGSGQATTGTNGTVVHSAATTNGASLYSWLAAVLSLALAWL